MLGVIDFGNLEGIARDVALAIPVAILVTLAFLLMAKYRRKFVTRTENPVEPALQSSRSPRDRDKEAPVTMAIFEAAEPPAAAPAQDLTLIEKPAAAAGDAGIAALSDLLKTVGAAGHAAIYLDIADAYGATGDEAARMTALRSAAGLAAKHGPPADHARARLALADAAFVAGDLTSACEQWQLARAALLDGGDKAASERVGQRMRDTGCPTDWVLTDF